MGPEAKEKMKLKNEIETADSKAFTRNKVGQSPGRANQSAFVGSEAPRSAFANEKGDSRLKATVGRQSNDKDYKFKKWRDAELEEAEKQRR